MHSWLRRLLLGWLGSAAVLLSAAPRPLHVNGNQLVDDQGRPVRLRGVNCAGLEFSSDGQGRILKTVRVAIEQWHANFIRLPLSQDRWFGRGPEQTDGGAAYRALVARIVDLVAADDAYILLDLHWSDGGEWGRHIGQHDLPDRNSVAFWKDFAPRFKDNPAVLFDLYNEPCRIGWDQWKNGGMLTERDEKTGDILVYQGIGLQEVLDVIRAAGAKNVVFAGGINWSYETGGELYGYALSDPSGRGVVYAQHPYPHAFGGIGRETIAHWAARVEALARERPVFISEFGSMETSWPFPPSSGYHDERWNREMLATLEAHGWNWSAWDFHPSAWPCLLSDWNYTPSPHFGVWVRQALQANASRGFLLVANKGDHTLSIVDVDAGRQIAAVPEDGVTGHEVAASPDGRLAFVPIYGNSVVARAGTNGGLVRVIDVARHALVGTVDFGRGVRPHGAVFNPRDGLLYVTAELAEAVEIVDPSTLAVVGSIPTGQETSHMLAISADGRRGYTANFGPGTVSVLDLEARRLVAVIPVSPRIQRISISKDDYWVFTADQTRPRLAVIDASTDAVAQSIPLPGIGFGTTPTPDGRWLLVTLPGRSEIGVVDLAEMRLARTVPMPRAPQEIAVRPDGTEAYVSCDAAGKVAVLDLRSWAVTRLIDVGPVDDGLAWAPEN